MPSRVIPGIGRGDNSPARSGSPLSESEMSFVSAASENTPSERPCISQSTAALSPSSPRRDQVTPNSNTAGSTLPGKAAVQSTPLARAIIPASPSSKATFTSPPGSYFTPQPGASGIDARSPTHKRPPASRSSHGIETRSGPPPALSTRRSHNAEPPWRSPPSTDATVTPQVSAANGSIDSIITPTKSTPHNNHHRNVKGCDVRRGSLDSMATRQKAQESVDDDPDQTLRLGGRRLQTHRWTDGQVKQQEDLFLNLARADSVADNALDNVPTRERRRSLLGHSASGTSRPPSSCRPSSRAENSSAQDLHSPQNSSFDSPAAISCQGPLRDDPCRDRPYAASAHPLGQRHRKRNSGLSSKAPFSSPQQDNGDSPLTYGRRRSVNTSSQSKYNSSPLHERPGYVRGEEAAPRGRGDGTESTVSTTAPSTVWDELDDLKSRIRKIELTGNLPSNSHAAMSQVYGDRPVTATTTVTTMSSSPKRRQRASASPEASTIQKDPVADLHPLLHSALAKTKSKIDPNLYKPLEATASDALSLAAMTGSKSSQGAANTPNGSITDRQLRRKVDSMCRSLTELCIALAEDKVEAEAISRVRPASRDATTSILPRSENPRFSRAASEDPELRASSRVMNRLEARRASLLGTSSFGIPSPKDSPQTELRTPTQEIPSLLSKHDKTSRNRDEDNESTASRRPLSRAATEVGSHKSSPQTRTPREYTSQHPMPNASNRSPSMQSSLLPRKTYFPATSTRSPVASDVQPGNRRYLDRSTPPAMDNARLADLRQQRIVSHGQGSSTVGAARSLVSSGRFRQVELGG
ncbi:MAG: hypothetical protein Q9163_001513 [Psora crenata]